jgi:hypothetical protein
MISAIVGKMHSNTSREWPAIKWFEVFFESKAPYKTGFEKNKVGRARWDGSSIIRRSRWIWAILVKSSSIGRSPTSLPSRGGMSCGKVHHRRSHPDQREAHVDAEPLCKARDSVHQR